jgi:ATP-binding cassette, subfamily B, bacterial
MIGGPEWGMRFIRDDDAVTRERIKPGTVRRILPYARPHRLAIAGLLFITVVDALITVVNPLILRLIIDDGILPRRLHVVAGLSAAIAALALAEALAMYVQGQLSARVGEGLVYELRTSVFRHVQRQPLAFFTRTQTGSLVSRLNNDVNEAQRADVLMLSLWLRMLLTVVGVLIAMFYLSWQISILALAAIPLFILPGRLIGRRQHRLVRAEMHLQGELATMTAERFNVAGAMLAKLYGRPEEEAGLFASRAGRIRDINIVSAAHARLLVVGTTLIAALTTALIYGLGGTLVIHGVLQVGTLVAMIALISRLYGPINTVSNLQIDVVTALVSFDRVFEVLDLKPLITERPGAYPLPASGQGGEAAPRVEFDRVSFRYPRAGDITLPSLESVTLPAPERAASAWVLREVSFCAPGGRLTALVGPSGAGKTTITHLVPRLYDPATGAVRIDGHDVRELTLASLRDTVGVVPQDAHLFHDTIRANLAYARPGASEDELIAACRDAQIWELISSLPDGLDTVTGDRGYRLSGGEKQRVALARLLLKAPTVVILDEATAHLDSESEAAIQRALKTALADRTSLVIAHRLSTIREADQILVIDEGQIRERGTHEQLLRAAGVYADLYRTQFARQAVSSA